MLLLPVYSSLCLSGQTLGHIPNKKEHNEKRKTQLAMSTIIIPIKRKRLQTLHTVHCTMLSFKSYGNSKSKIWILYTCMWFYYTVRPLLSGHLLSDHPPLSGQFSEVPIYLSVNCCIRYLYSMATSVKQLQPPFCHKCIIYMFFYLH